MLCYYYVFVCFHFIIIVDLRSTLHEASRVRLYVMTKATRWQQTELLPFGIKEKYDNGNKCAGLILDARLLGETNSSL